MLDERAVFLGIFFGLRLFERGAVAGWELDEGIAGDVEIFWAAVLCGALAAWAGLVAGGLSLRIGLAGWLGTGLLRARLLGH